MENIFRKKSIKMTFNDNKKCLILGVILMITHIITTTLLQKEYNNTLY